MIGAFKLLAFSAIAQEKEVHHYMTPFGPRAFYRAEGAALHPTREPLEVLETQRKLLGTQHFAAQYLQSPSAPGGNLVKREWLPRFDLAALPRFDRIVQSWDTASKANAGADHSVCATFGTVGKHAYLLHILRRRMEYPELKREVRRQKDLFGAHEALIEDCASGIALIQELRSEGMAGLREVKASQKDKITRLDVHTAMLEAGFMHIPTSAPWLDAYLHELLMFPKAKYDDQVDATSQALSHLFARIGPEAWLQELYEWKAREKEKDIPTFRVNHPDLGRQFILITGRQPHREADGSFLVTVEELAPLRFGAGMIFIDTPPPDGSSWWRR